MMRLQRYGHVNSNGHCIALNNTPGKASNCHSFSEYKFRFGLIK